MNQNSQNVQGKFVHALNMIVKKIAAFFESEEKRQYKRWKEVIRSWE